MWRSTYSYRGSNKHKRRTPRIGAGHRILRSPHFKSAVLFGVSILVAVAALVPTIWKGSETLDGYHCSKSRLPQQTVGILLDATDGREFASTVKEKLLQAVESYRDTLGEGDRLSIFLLGSDAPGQEGKLYRIFSACKPGDPDKASQVNHGRKYVQRQYQRIWAEPLQASLEAIERRPHVESSTTPLMMSIKTLSARELVSQGSRTLLVMSDLLENSDHVSFYAPRCPDFTRTKNAGYDIANVSNILANARVTVWQLPQPATTTQCIGKFWADYMREAGARYESTAL